METFLVEFEKGADADGIMRNHPGQEFCFVLSGKIEFTVDDKIFLLVKNDSFNFNSARYHKARNIGKNKAQISWIVTPPES